MTLNQNKLFLLFILLALLAGCIAPTPLSETSAPIPQASTKTSVPIETLVPPTATSSATTTVVPPWPPNMGIDSWKTYTNEDFYFSFIYPAEWFLYELGGSPVPGVDGVEISNYNLDTLPAKGPAPANFFKMRFILHANDPLIEGQTLDDWIESRGMYIKQEQTLQIAGREARELVRESYPGVVGYEVLLIVDHPEYGKLVLSITPPSSALENQEIEGVFRKILSTLRIGE
jgi:hypothetical protein